MNVERSALGPGYSNSRLIRGGWQLAGGHGAIDRERAIADMEGFVDAGVTTFDCADIYTGVEEMIGAFRARLLARGGSAAAAQLQVHTKYVPDYDRLGRLTKADVEQAIDRSLHRLGTDRLDLVQFHWWNYAADGMLETLHWLAELRTAGKIAHLGGTNFDTPTTRAIVNAGIPLVSMQVQYSLLDQRPENGLVELARQADIGLLCYGTVAGGFLSARWLGQPEPQEPYANRSLVKYKLIIDDFGGWALFQRLLATLDDIARKHGVGITAVATRSVLDRPQVAGVIVGARYGDQLADNLKAFHLVLDEADRAAVAAVLAERQGPAGDTYTLERDKDGRHGRIMKYNLNRE
jgi:aryl-alcohol dehydrogenase-like predicted oxidoreductase